MQCKYMPKWRCMLFFGFCFFSNAKARPTIYLNTHCSNEIMIFEAGHHRRKSLSLSFSHTHTHWCCFKENVKKKMTLVSDQPSGVFLRKVVCNSKSNCWSKVYSSKKKNYRFCAVPKEIQLCILNSFCKAI